MTVSEAASLLKLGGRSPRVTFLGTSGRDFADPSPSVPWEGARRAAVMQFEVETPSRRR